eukprot:TRINITY_DN67907_c4_g4_i1.p1 TRINITY_DN67907_c4_g4~~TRINITY_DN67907_c4_g4_i1.p1  ORF type:complete len:232 (-),score=66.40 TRINITY_DN67907_c4_g4_i1:313-1008(-)
MSMELLLQFLASRPTPTPKAIADAQTEKKTNTFLNDVLLQLQAADTPATMRTALININTMAGTEILNIQQTVKQLLERSDEIEDEAEQQMERKLLFAVDENDEQSCMDEVGNWATSEMSSSLQQLQGQQEHLVTVQTVQKHIRAIMKDAGILPSTGTTTTTTAANPPTSSSSPVQEEEQQQEEEGEEGTNNGNKNESTQDATATTTTGDDDNATQTTTALPQPPPHQEQQE